MEDKLRILAASDIHGNFGISKKLSEKAKRKKVDLIILAGDIYGYDGGDERVLEPFMKMNQKVLFVPGNLDFDEDVYFLKSKAKCIHNYYVTYNDVAITGIGSPNWKLTLDEKDFEKIKRNFYKMKSNKKILISHLHPRGTNAEFSGIPGDSLLKKAIEKFKPDVVIAGHIHEAEGLEDKIGNTKVIQVGKSGTILEI